MNTMSRWTVRSWATANGPTSASDGRADAAGEDDRLVLPPGSVEHLGHLQRVGDDGDAGHVAMRPASAYVVVPAERASAIPGSTSLAATAAIAAFSACWRADLVMNAGLVAGEAGGRRGAAVHLLEEPLLVEDLEVAADGHVRDLELADEVRDPDRADLADAIQDQRLALASEHSLRSWPVPVSSRTVRGCGQLPAPNDRAARDGKSTQINKILR